MYGPCGGYGGGYGLVGGVIGFILVIFILLCLFGAGGWGHRCGCGC